MSLQGARCPICTAQFSRGQVGALRCGHTFHEACIKIWLDKNKTCPNCRARTTERELIKQLYFDYEDDSSNTSQILDPATELEELKISLKNAQSEVLELKNDAKTFSAEKDSFQSQIDTLKRLLSKRDAKLASANEMIRNMELIADQKDHVLDMIQAESRESKKRLTEVENALKATEFFKLVVKSKGENQAMEAFRKYVKPNGEIEVESFLNLLKLQVSKYKQLSAKQQEEAKVRQSEIAKLSEEKRKLQEMIHALTEELAEMRASCNKNTPYNPKLKPFLQNRSPVKRISMGFDQSISLDMNVFDSAIRKPPLKKPFRENIVRKAEESKEKIVVRDLDHFCELYDAKAIPVADMLPEQSGIVDKGDGIFIPKRTLEAQCEPDPEIYVSPIKKAHIRMEAENWLREEGGSDGIRAPPQRKSKSRTAIKRVVPKEKSTNRISQFFRRTTSKNSAPNSPEVIHLD